MKLLTIYTPGCSIRKMVFRLRQYTDRKDLKAPPESGRGMYLTQVAVEAHCCF